MAWLPNTILVFTKPMSALLKTENLTHNAPIATKVVCFSRLLKYLRSLYSNSVDPEQTAPIVCSYTLQQMLY